MTMRLALSIVAAALAVQFAAPDAANAGELKNLTVLDKGLGKTIGKGMKSLSKGLGVKCTACHIKGKLDSDEKAEKAASRDFLKVTVVGPCKPGMKEDALKALLKTLKLEKAKDEAKVWAAIEMWKPKKDK